MIWKAGLALALSGASPVLATDLVWEVENPFRLYKHASSFQMHERAFAAVRGNLGDELPSDIVTRIERHLNAPDCRDPSTPATCAATIRDQRRFAASRLGWAATTYNRTCYDSDARPRRYPAACSRTYGRRAVREDYILPASHVVNIGLSAERLAQAGDGGCEWTWQPRAGGAAAETKSQACKQKLVIDKVPYAVERARSGVAVEVTLPDGTKLATPDVVVEDLLVVALGDSFASGESNPDKPVTFGNREIVYEPFREEIARTDDGLTARRAEEPQRSAGQNPRALPRRLMEDEERGEQYRRSAPEFIKAFYQRSAAWLSADCHRSQYGYPFRVAMQLALENRHRAVTLVHLACTGAQVTEGLFAPQDAREDFAKPNSTSVPAQLDQLTDLICRDAAPAQRRRATYNLPFFNYGRDPAMRTIAKHWCAPDRRKRDIDLVLLSIGGNDVGFSPLAAYAMTESAGDIAPIVAWLGKEIRFGPDVARKYLDVLDERLKAVKDALSAGFGVKPARVIQTSYEPIQYDETGGLCGARPTLGMDVHPNLKLGPDRLQAAARFFDALLQRLECMTDGRRAGCGRLATGEGTGFTLVTEHQATFRRRGLCARDPARAEADGAAMAIPRFNPLKSEFYPYHPAYYTPYASRQRLFRTPNDAFLTANTHYEKILLYDILQPVYAALYSGAIHPTAEGHAIVADHVMPHARRVLGDAAPISARQQ